MRKNRRNNNHASDLEQGLSNFALTLAKAMMVITVFLLSVFSIEEENSKKEGIKPNAEMILTVDWPEGRTDVDVWIRAPSGDVLYYRNQAVGFMTLERDDMGTRTDTVIINGKEVIAKQNQEIVSFRGFEPGEYVVNLMLFANGVKGNEDPETPINVEITFEKLNPYIRTLFKKTVRLSYVREEKHVFRFTITEDGQIIDIIDNLPTSLIQIVQ